MFKVLIADDDTNFLELAENHLGQEFEVYTADTGQTALESIRNYGIDIAIIDLHMPDGDGLFVCRELSSNNKFQKVETMILSGDIAEESKLAIFALGAADFVEKPVSFKLLAAKLRARISKIKTDTDVLRPPLLEKRDGDFYFDGKLLVLSSFEKAIFNFLLANRGYVVSRKKIYTEVWEGRSVSQRTVDVHIANLRKKLPKSVNVESVYGRGYVLNCSY